MKRISLLAALVLLLGFLAGCGNDSSSGASDEAAGDGGAPTNASVEEFCGAFIDMIQEAGTGGADMSDADAVALAKKLANKLQEVGTPEDMPADARKGFELALQKINDLPDDATQAEMEAANAELTEEEKGYQKALSDYITEKCMGSMLPSGAASPSQ